jgi:hypothetical protein
VVVDTLVGTTISVVTSSVVNAASEVVVGVGTGTSGVGVVVVSVDIVVVVVVVVVLVVVVVVRSNVTGGRTVNEGSTAGSVVVVVSIPRVGSTTGESLVVVIMVVVTVGC